MGILARLFGRRPSKPAVITPAKPPETVPARPPRRSYTVKLPGGVVETRYTDRWTGTFDDWVAEMEAKLGPEELIPALEKVTIDTTALRALDLRDLPSTRFRIVGSSYCVTEDERALYGGTDYLLKREPDNGSDANAVAVFGQGRKVGYLSAAKAASLAELLDGLDFDAFQVGGTSVLGNSIRLWVDVPKVAALRLFVAGLGESEPQGTEA
ncbi:hypothetical protein E3T35_09325 [Cryobacterium sp. TMT1-2-2]|nr:hypothetical protein E3T35_09325 [Cryobacterium sp. TMT1-2-2]